MKKALIVLILAVFSAPSFAQDGMTSKKGTPILPETGEWAIGINADPFIEYVGNLMNNTEDNSSPSWGSPVSSGSSPVLYLKMVKDDKTHYRAMVRLNFGSSKLNLVVEKDSTDGSSFSTPQYGNDEVKTSGNGITLGAGIEKRRGKGRLQGFYGAMAMLGIGGGKTTHSFANAITKDNPYPTTSSGLQGGLYRIKEVKQGSTFEFGVRGFIGVEFFFMPKASIGAEFGWGIGLSSTGEGSTTSEGINSTLDGVETRTVPGPGKASSFGLDTDTGYGVIKGLFYF